MRGLTGLLAIVIVGCIVSCHSAAIVNHRCSNTVDGMDITCECYADHFELDFWNNFENATSIEITGSCKDISISKLFKSLKSLTVLAQLTQLSGDDFPDSIVNLIVRHNKLTFLDVGSFPAGLQFIHASNNLITKVDFESLPAALFFLNLDRNNIPSLNLDPLEGRKPALSMYVTNNPVFCTCALIRQFAGAVESGGLVCGIRGGSACFKCRSGGDDRFLNYSMYSEQSKYSKLRVTDAMSAQCLSDR